MQSERRDDRLECQRDVSTYVTVFMVESTKPNRPTASKRSELKMIDLGVIAVFGVVVSWLLTF
ncbi:hypothetical protein C7S18_05995 [Ahniella affigens]|uniref:Uncharacterized protein n=1 Tax=Ahniella affigens TaxID=2021234 RepID=A0A2P1PPK9_9GAMM|nr:hypothetical protein C7S18_05995 [Ahniella affigens]